MLVKLAKRTTHLFLADKQQTLDRFYIGRMYLLENYDYWGFLLDSIVTNVERYETFKKQS
ncbi:unnamed protein product [Acanthoscelides obtectus]|uniref:Uncharacterized protein n=1 Tax=Acanthoscelides obtectus TaxID=200917 RepID=A0A9P0L5D0_ACAOB|nr:unnamed protein product [Acanthoscelides obtectus]CAK1651828.1 hypothetical protein AOBTE_LOCUS17482 [Acanthoscelides obtectus]